MESPRQGAVAWPPRRLSRLKPPAMAINTTATTQRMTASVSSQPRMSCHAGRVKRKKLSGRAEDGITDAAGGVRRVPEERQGGPLRHHRGPGQGRCHERADDADDAQHRFDGKIHRLPAEDDLASAGQAGLAGPLERQKCAVQEDEGCDGEEREDAPLDPPRGPEDVPVAERAEPEQVHPVGEGGLGREENCGDDDEKDNQLAPQPRTARPPRLQTSLRKVNRTWHISTPLYLFLMQPHELYRVGMKLTAFIPLWLKPPYAPFDQMRFSSLKSNNVQAQQLKLMHLFNRAWLEYNREWGTAWPPREEWPANATRTRD